MAQFNIELFRRTHPSLYKTSIEAINHALNIDLVSFSLPTTEQMEDQSYVIGKEYRGDYPDVLEEGFEMCYDWIKERNTNES
jgi:hypothetical protein